MLTGKKQFFIPNIKRILHCGISSGYIPGIAGTIPRISRRLERGTGGEKITNKEQGTLNNEVGVLDVF